MDWPRVLTCGAWLGGWALVGVPIVYGFASVAPWWVPAAGWLGVLALGLGGWRSLLIVLIDGVRQLGVEGDHAKRRP